MCLFREMKWAACLVKFHFRLKLPGQPGVGLRFGQAQGALRRFHRFGKPPGFGEGGGEGVENDRILPAGQCIGLPGQFDRLVAVAQRRLRTGGEEPSQIILNPWIGWFELQRLLEMGDRFAHFALLQKNIAEIVLGVAIVRVDLERLLVLGDRFVHSSLLLKNVAEIDMGSRVPLMPPR